MAAKAKRSKARVTRKPDAAAKTSTTEKKPLRPGECRAYMRNTLASEFRGIVDGFVKGAQSGSCQHVKLATELLAPPKRVTKAHKMSGGATLSRWLDEIESEV